MPSHMHNLLICTSCLLVHVIICPYFFCRSSCSTGMGTGQQASRAMPSRADRQAWTVCHSKMDPRSLTNCRALWLKVKIYQYTVGPPICFRMFHPHSRISALILFLWNRCPVGPPLHQIWGGDEVPRREEWPGVCIPLNGWIIVIVIPFDSLMYSPDVLPQSYRQPVDVLLPRAVQVWSAGRPSAPTKLDRLLVPLQEGSRIQTWPGATFDKHSMHKTVFDCFIISHHALVSRNS